VRLIIQPTGFYADDVTTGTKLGVLGGSSATNLDTWVYWALVRTGQTLTLFRDGTQVATASLGNEGASTLNGSIGACSNQYFLNGDVGQVAAYSTALTPAAIELHYEAGTGG
jgi:hypothetical protein